MTISITARGIEVSPPDRQYANDKAEKLLRIFNGVSKIEVLLSQEGKHYRAEMVLTVVKGDRIAVHVDHDQLRAAIDLVSDKGEKLLVRHKEKLRDHRGPDLPRPARGEAGEGLESYQDVVDKTDFEE